MMSSSSSTTSTVTGAVGKAMLCWMVVYFGVANLLIYWRWDAANTNAAAAPPPVAANNDATTIAVTATAVGTNASQATKTTEKKKKNATKTAGMTTSPRSKTAAAAAALKTTAPKKPRIELPPLPQAPVIVDPPAVDDIRPELELQRDALQSAIDQYESELTQLEDALAQLQMITSGSGSSFGDTTGATTPSVEALIANLTQQHMELRLMENKFGPWTNFPTLSKGSRRLSQAVRRFSDVWFTEDLSRGSDATLEIMLGQLDRQVKFSHDLAWYELTELLRTTQSPTAVAAAQKKVRLQQQRTRVGVPGDMAAVLDSIPLLRRYSSNSLRLQSLCPAPHADNDDDDDEMAQDSKDGDDNGISATAIVVDNDDNDDDSPLTMEYVKRRIKDLKTLWLAAYEQEEYYSEDDDEYDASVAADALLPIVVAAAATSKALDDDSSIVEGSATTTATIAPDDDPRRTDPTHQRLIDLRGKLTEAWFDRAVREFQSKEKQRAIQAAAEQAAAAAKAAKKPKAVTGSEGETLPFVTLEGCATNTTVQELWEAGLQAVYKHQDIRNALLKALSQKGIDTRSVILDAILYGGTPQRRPLPSSPSLSNQRRRRRGASTTAQKWRAMLDQPWLKEAADVWIPAILDGLGGHHHSIDHWLDTLPPNVGRVWVAQLLDTVGGLPMWPGASTTSTTSSSPQISN